MTKSKSGEHGVLHPVNWLAAEFGVSGTVLAHLLGPGQFTVREAYEALSGKIISARDRQRRQNAEAEMSEILLAEKKGILMLTANHVRWCRELGTQTRVTISAAEYIPLESRKRLCNEIAKIRITA
jgi:hypothetical protein